MMWVRVMAAVLLAVLGCVAQPARAEDAVQLQMITQPRNGTADARPINIDAGDPVTIGTKLALIITARADATVSLRYTPSDGAPALLAQGIALKAGESKRVPEDGGWYSVTSGLGEEKLAAEDASGAVLAKTSYRIVDSSVMQIGNLVTESAGSGATRTRSIGGVNLGAYDQATDVVAKSETVAKALEQAPAAAASTNRSVGSNVFKKVANGVVLVVNGDFIGAGAILNQGGLVVTNHHVVAGADEVSVIFMPAAGASVDGAKSYDATVERIDVVADLALIRIKNPPQDMTLVALGDPSSVEIGEEVNAIGHPHGEFWSYARGYVSQIRPKYGWDDSHYEHQADVIQTQTPINPGNSGGPLLDDEGRLIGINSFVDAGAQGLNYAVSVDEVTRVMQMNGDRLADGSLIEAKASESNDSGAKVQSAAQTGSSENDYETWSYDDNHDGKPERWGVDVSGDGKPDLYLLDQDGDGAVDYGLLDRNQDGKPEARIIYGNEKTGECDVWEIDDNEDGTPDSIGMDYDYDGKPDVIRPA
ncbi:S1C family serine protease [Dongia sedimenti]|uniref:Trypsin-like peptidase domain-containing protein n=1 Tax=Dongia sedimenti TaxID=3064282 RepID=A0ABU0YML3_9PROT|nr:trypsin-like peptidase domain-containing protein [Rhodospirillaceae bacterium R-7]